jgi:hypothetical protein
MLDSCAIFSLLFREKADYRELVSWLFGWLVGWLVNCVVFVGWLAGWLVGWSVGRSVGRSAGWLVGRSVGWSVGRSVGCLVSCVVLYSVPVQQALQWPLFKQSFAVNCHVPAAIFIYVVGSSDGQTERANSCENRGPVCLQCWQYQTWSAVSA